MPPPATSPIARARLDLDALPRAERLDRWREALEPVFEITPDAAENGTAFSGVIAMAHLGDALISEVRSGPQLFDRSRAHARRSGLDHFMVQTFRHGSHDGACGDSPVHRRQGDVWILDLGQETRTQASHFANVTLIIPRDRVLPLLKGGEVHGATLRQGSASARLIASHLETLSAAAPELTLAEATAAVDAAALMIAGAWSSLRETRAEVGAAIRATARRAVGDHIDRHLMDERLSPESLRRQFRMSRATLYRLFEDEGGVAAYILGRRLDRCRALLAADSPPRQTIGEIAFGHGFASDAHFSRAFRRRFGMAPRDVRGTYLPQSSALSSGVHADVQTISEWIATLRRQHLRLSGG
jgi:AraC-like DNA-binding protein